MRTRSGSFDLVVVGGGIVGLAHAYLAARDGRRVALLERSVAPVGASVRNFGMFWPIGMAPGRDLGRAMFGRGVWLEIAERYGVRAEACGSVHAARTEAEAAVLREFAGVADSLGYAAEFVTPEEARSHCPALRADGLIGGLWSSTELALDPASAIRQLHQALRTDLGVEVRCGTAAARVESGVVHTAGGERFEGDRIIVASGQDFETLFPAVFAESPITRCKLQMMRTDAQPGGWRLGTHLAGGLTLRHYSAFQGCRSLPALKRELDAAYPEYGTHGIHVMASQTGAGQVVIGDSHQYGLDVPVFDSARIDELILGYLRAMVELPDPAITERWHGVYAKRTDGRTVFHARPMDGVDIVNAIGGAGMTLSFGVASEVLRGARADVDEPVQQAASLERAAAAEPAATLAGR